MRKIVINGVEVDLDALKSANTGPKEEPQTVTRSFSGNTLTVEDAIADVNIRSTDATIIEVVITGPKSLIDNIDVSEADGNVAIKGENGGRNCTTVIRSGGNVISMSQSGRSGVQIGSIGGGATIISGGNIIINDDGKPETTIDIKVPIGTDLDLSDISGRVSIGDTKSNLRARISGSGSIYASSIKKLYGRISGSGDLTVENITGDASVRVSGSGDVNINNGNIEELEVEVSGSGDVRVYATAQTADLSASGSGDIYVAHVVKSPRKHASGFGDIKVGRIG